MPSSRPGGTQGAPKRTPAPPNAALKNFSAHLKLSERLIKFCTDLLMRRHKKHKCKTARASPKGAWKKELMWRPGLRFRILSWNCLNSRFAKRWDEARISHEQFFWCPWPEQCYSHGQNSMYQVRKKQEKQDKNKKNKRKRGDFDGSSPMNFIARRWKRWKKAISN